MVKLIKLHGTGGRTVYVNINSVVAVKEDESKDFLGEMSNTNIYIESSAKINVIETLDEVVTMIRQEERENG